MLETILLTKQDHCITTTKKKQKGIYGNASKKQIKELQEEGIETETFPWIEDKNN